MTAETLPARVYLTGAEAALGIAIFTLPLALGGAWPFAPWLLAACAALSLSLVVIDTRRENRSLSLPLLSLIPLAVAALCVLQLLPLPPRLLDLASPLAGELRDFVLAPLGLGGDRPISLDPPATWRELSKHSAYAALMLASAQVASSRRARHRLFQYLALSGVMVALTGYGHALVGARSLFGLVHFEHASPDFLTPFGNANHLAAFLTFTTTVSLGLAVRTDAKERAWLWTVAYVVSGAAVFLSLSRAGIFFFVAAQAMCGVLLLTARREKGARKSRQRSRRGLAHASWAATAVLAVLFAAAYVSFERIRAELETADTAAEIRRSKIELWPSFATAARAFRRTGMGRGAFEAGFPRFQSEGSPLVTFTHPENVFLQLWSELGLAAALLLSGFAAYGMFRLVRRREFAPPDIAILAGVVGVVLHDLFDFAMELPPTASVMAIGLGIVSRVQEEDLRNWICVPDRAVEATFVVLALSVVPPLTIGRSSLKAAEAQLASLYTERTSADWLEQRAHNLFAQHPSDYWLYGTLALAYAAEPGGDAQRALSFANRALYLKPTDGRSHLASARALLKLNRRPQAFLEYRSALGSGMDVLEEGLRRARGADELSRLLPDSPAVVIQAARKLWRTGRREEAEELVQKKALAVEDLDGSAELFAVASNFRLQRADYTASLDFATKAAERAPKRIEPVLAKAEALVGLGRRSDAIALLDARRLEEPSKLPLAFTLSRLFVAEGSTRRARDALERVKPFVETMAERVQWSALMTDAYFKEGRLALALEEARRASRLAPTSAQLHYQVGRICEELQRFDDARSAINDGMRHDSKEGMEQARAWLAALETKKEALAQKREQELLDTAQAVQE